MTEVTEEYKKEVTRIRILRVECDGCGLKVPTPSGFVVREFTLEFAKGKSYPEAGYEEGWSVPDLCDVCVRKLRALLVDNGFRIVPVSRDW